MSKKDFSVTDMFYGIDDWLLDTHPELLEVSEIHYLFTQFKLARIALVKRIEEEL